MRNIFPIIVLAIGAMSTGCVGRPSTAATELGASPHASDGIFMSLPLEADAAFDAAVSALQASGYIVENSRSARRTLRTRPRAIGADTSVIVTAQIEPVDLPNAASMVVLSATYSVPSQCVRDKLVVDAPGSPQGLWMRLRDVAGALRNPRPVAPAPP